MSDTIDAVFDTVARAAGDIRAGLPGRREYAGGENPTGDRQLAADRYADELLEERLLAIDGVAAYASEERESVSGGGDGPYRVACDPLDGSSNLESNNGMGTIVSVYDEPLPAGGGALVAACYVLYGPVTTMVSVRDGTVTESLVEGGRREDLAADVELPADPVVYGFGGRVPDWTPAFRAFVAGVEADRLKLRYGGALVGDVNQVLSYGGIFGYPMLRGRPEGKLRLQFEGQPIGAIVEAAGGASSDGNGSLLDREPSGLHERTPLFVGNEPLIDDLEEHLA
jgi:fructose-1,6-bisphosphatase I